MAEKPPSQKGSGIGRKLWLALPVVAILLVLGAVAARKQAPVEGTVSDITTYSVKEAPLWVTVVEGGTIRPRDPVILKCDVGWASGPPQILWLIPEGEEVKKGDLLVRLDSSLFENQLIDQEMWDQQTQSGLISVGEALKVMESKAESDIKNSELQLRFAGEDVRKYIEGDFPNELKAKKTAVTLAESSLAAAADDLEGTELLFAKNFATPIELDTAKRLMQRASLEVELAKGREELLKNFTYKRRVDQLESDVKQAERDLERTKLKANAEIAKLTANLVKTEHWSRFGKRNTDRSHASIENSEIYAPVDGTVVHATGWRPLEEGQTVHRHQELIHLITENSAKVEISLGESDLGKVEVGQRVRITVEALPGTEFTGYIDNIAMMPDAEKSWMGAGSNVYATEVFVDGDGSALRPGMSCQAEILVEHHEKAISVPVESVIRVNGAPTVYVDKEGEIEPRAVELGVATENMIRILANLDAGERVLLAPPLEEAAVFHDEPIAGAQSEALPAGHSSDASHAEGAK
jgi:HlyD family secretion protein